MAAIASANPSKISTSTVVYTRSSRLLVSFSAAENPRTLWFTSGTTLTYPTTYVKYVAFAGTTANGGGCANSLPAKSLTTPSYINPTRFILPLAAYTTVPTVLVGFLDAQSDFMSQFGTNGLWQCGQFATVDSRLETVINITPQAAAAAGLSPSAIGGISVAAFLAIFSAFIGGCLILRRRRLVQSVHEDKPELGASLVASGAELESDEVVEAGSGPLAEADAEAQLAAEMHTHHAAHELHDQAEPGELVEAGQMSAVERI